MNPILHPKKRRLQECNRERQLEFENSIINDDAETFLRLIKEDGISSTSVVALKNAAETKNNLYLQKIIERLQPEQFRNFLSDALASEKVASIAPTTKKAKVEQKTVKNSLVEEIVSTWPFRIPQVVWKEKYCFKKDDKPMNLADSEKIWLLLFVIAEKFCNNKSLHEEIYAKIEELACSEKERDEKLETKLKNMRQTVRLCFQRLLRVKYMKIKVQKNDETTATVYSFDQFCKKYAVPLPKASNFKGIGPAFANSFQQYLNSMIFEGTEFQCTKIEYQIDEPENEASVEESDEGSE